MKKLLTLLTISTLTLSGIVAGGGYLLTNNPNQVLSTNNYQQQKQKETNPPWKEQPHKYDGTKVTEIGWKTLDDGTVQIEPFKENTTEVPAYLPPFITSLNGAFWDLESSSVKNLDKWDTSKVTDMKFIFYRAKNFNQDISTREVEVNGKKYKAWNTSNVTDMISVFDGAEKFNQPIGNWNTSNVTDMIGMFSRAKNFNQPIGNWNTSNVTNMASMFSSAYSFNQDISMWNTSNVRNMYYMFAGADAFDQDISKWNVNNVTKWDYFNWNYGNYYRPHQIPPKFRNYNPNNTKTLSIALGIVGGVVGISVLASTIYLYKRKKINQ
ncbi:BspA family leucine-rich repeat surface protein [Mycoplasma leachii]|uniref:BspA family leucine-rich repeat surface protein n=1 Tax=Mycoplasma leachii TaxID=2105 RepID=UPI003DA5B8FB